MPLSFANAPGNLFNCIGKIGATIATMRSYQATQLQAFVNTTTGIVAQFNNESDIQALMGSNYIQLLNSPGSSIGSFCQNIAVETLNRKVFRDTPQLNQTLQQVNLEASLFELVRQMRSAGATVLAMTVAASPGAFVGLGNGVVNASVKRPVDGLVLENSFAENIQFICTSDSYSGSATAGNEGFSVTGVGSEGDAFAFNWPLGSNSSTTMSAIDGNTSVGAGNLLTNSGFSNWTNNVPDNWSLVVGTAGVNINRESSIVYDSTYALRITGDGSGTLTELTELFNNEAGTVGILSPQTQYSFNLFTRRGGSSISAGVWEVALVDDAGTIVQDENGESNSFTITLSGLNTVYTSYKGVFRTPAIMPNNIYLRMRLTTALPNNISFYIDKVSLGEMQQLYQEGPFLAAHSGSIPFQISDYEYCAITNSKGAAGTLNTFQIVASILWNTPSFGILLPSSSTPTINDSLLAP